jgi:hypothetical protein
VSFYVDETVFSGIPGELITAAYRTSDDELPTPLCWQLILDLGGCDDALTTNREHIAAWGEGLHGRLQLGGAGPTVAFDVFGPAEDPAVVARFAFRQPGWRGVAQPYQADAVVRCDPGTHGVHLDFVSTDRPGTQTIAAFAAEHFAARCGAGECRARRVPGLTTGFKLIWQEDYL